MSLLPMFPFFVFMELNEIKKQLYREKPLAGFLRATSVSLTYRTTIKKDADEDADLYFLIPISDVGDAVFEKFMPAQQLIRWIVDTNVNEQSNH